MEPFMRRNVSALAEKEYDLIIVGGGIFGICAAWDATLRGLSVALIERGDFAHATSANHFKLVHGGMRYLQHADLYRVRESSLERNILLRIAPHLVHPLPFVIPTYGHGMQGKEVLATGLFLYDLVTFDRNQGIEDPQRRIPRGRLISRQECLQMFPHLEQKGLTGAAIFYECQMYNPTRLSLSFLRSAVKAGTEAVNYMQATDFIKERDRVIGVRAQDTLTGDKLEIRGRVVINAAGPWAHQLLRRSMGTGLNSKPSFSRDALFAVGRQLLSEKYALGVQAETRDADAIVSRGHRHLFLIPWRDYTLVGVWHVVHNGGADEFIVTEQELQKFLDEINEAYPSLDLTLKDISIWNAGLILFGNNNSEEIDHSFGKRSIIIDHAKDDQVEGLVTLIGVRYTTARGTAERAVDLVFNKLGKKPPKSATPVTPIYGGQIACFDQYLHQATAQRPRTLSTEVIPSLIHNYGSAYRNVLKYIDEDATWSQTLGTSKVIKAEVVHAVREEMAQKLGDVVFRRTDLGTGGHPGETALQACADLMALELTWDKCRVEKELDEVRAVFPKF
jgi:glycerol-3-phosphate dehydrogenase